MDIKYTMLFADDWYFPERHTKASAVDIDHVVPLAHAHRHGADLWDSEKKERFANDPENLVITRDIRNRRKSSKSIADWLPMRKDYACKYIARWMKIKKKYNLRVDEDEMFSVKTANCD